ncbi:MAG: hypothetical protein ACJ75G_00085 [Gaiellaceae bacterium]
MGDLATALAEAWSHETSADPTSWTVENAAWGQCAVTALIVQDYFGGSLRRGEVGDVSHYWNVLPAGEVVDLTRQQFPNGTEIANIAARTREYVLSNLETARRYRRLAQRVDQRLSGRVLAAT